MELVQTPPWGHWGHSQLPKDGEWVRVALLTLGEGAMNISGYGTPMERDPRADGCFWLQHLHSMQSFLLCARSLLFPADRCRAAQWSHFTDLETDAQRDRMACPGPHLREAMEVGPQVCVHYTRLLGPHRVILSPTECHGVWPPDD